MNNLLELSTEEVKLRINAALMKKRDEPLDLDELELIAYEMDRQLEKAHNLMALVVTHGSTLDPHLLHLMQHVRFSLGYFSFFVREAKEKLSGQATT